MVASDASKQLTKTTKKLNNVQKLAKPKKDLSSASKLKNGGAAAYWGYKAFQALRVCSGDVTALAEIATELLGEGLCAGAVANPGMVVEAVEAVVGAQGGIKAFRKNIKNFAQFSAALSKQLNSDGTTQTNGQTMESAEHLYNMFMECDRDGSGGVSLEEYVAFSAREGVPRSMAETMFFQADVDGNGQISFGEWTAMMVGRVGRDNNTFNCGGRHGLSQYLAVFNGLACDFCQAPIRAGYLAKGCRRCDCDACASCSGLSSTRPVPPPPPPRPPPSVTAAGFGQQAVPAASPATSSSSSSSKKKKSKKAKKKPLQAPGALPSSAAAAPQPIRPEAGVSGGPPRSFDCRLMHGLAPFTADVGPVVGCDWCGSVVPPGQPCFGCRTCDMDGCADCAAASLGAPDGNASGLTCPGRHGLALELAAGGCVCDFCRGPVAAGAKVFSCTACAVDACVACVWKDHRRALSTGGVFECENFKAHVARPFDVSTPQQLSNRCSWCLGAPSLGHRIMRCDTCDSNSCALCVGTVPAQEAKIQRVKAAARKAQLVGTNTDTESAERLQAMSIGEVTASPSPPVLSAGGLPSSQPPLPPALPPPPCYGAVAAPSFDGQSAPELPPVLPSYGAMTGSSSAACPSGHVAEAPALPSYDQMAGSSPAAAPSYHEMTAIGKSPGGEQQPSSYSSFAEAGRARARKGRPPPASCSPGGEAPAPIAAGADNAAVSPFEFDSVVRVLGVEDPEVHAKLLTVIGFEADGGRGTIVLQRRGRVVRVPASTVYRVVD